MKDLSDTYRNGCSPASSMPRWLTAIIAAFAIVGLLFHPAVAQDFVPLPGNRVPPPPLRLPAPQNAVSVTGQGQRGDINFYGAEIAKQIQALLDALYLDTWNCDADKFTKDRQELKDLVDAAEEAENKFRSENLDPQVASSMAARTYGARLHADFTLAKDILANFTPKYPDPCVPVTTSAPPPPAVPPPPPPPVVPPPATTPSPGAPVGPPPGEPGSAPAPECLTPEAQERIKQLEEQLDDLLNKRSNIELELTKLGNSLTANENTIASDERSLSDLTKISVDEERELRSQIERLKTTNENLQKQIDDLKQQRAGVLENEQRVSEELDRLKATGPCPPPPETTPPTNPELPPPPGEPTPPPAPTLPPAEPPKRTGMVPQPPGTGSNVGFNAKPMTPAEEENGRLQAPPLEIQMAAIPVAEIKPGADVAKNDVVLVDTSTQKEIPGGKVVIIPADPKQPIPPPIPVKADGKATLPPLQREDRIVVLPQDHQKIELTGGNLPSDTGARLPLPQKPLRMVVHDTPCIGVGDRIVEQGLADQYGARKGSTAPGGWQGTDVRFGTTGFQRTDCVVEVPTYVPLKPGAPIVPKDGPTITQDRKLIEGDEPREIQGPAPTEPFATSQGTWGKAYADQWYLKAVRWLKDDGTTVLPDKASLVTVAVIDTGVDFSHPELAGAHWTNPNPGPKGNRYGWNFVDNSPEIRDRSGHGTIVAGIIAASSTDRFGIAGINPWARIMALKAMELDGKGGSIDVAQAIVYAAEHGARVINLSLGGRTLTRTEQDAIDYAARRDALVVVASGNEGIETTNFSPAGLKNVLAVAAVGPDLKRQAFSNWGGTIGIAAPGVDILSLRARQTDLLQMTRREYKPGTAVVAEQFYRVTGSSFAAPIVSGAASLLFSIRPELSAAQVKRMLLQSARDLDAIGTNQFTGYGLLDVEAAIAADPNVYAEAAITGVSVVQQRGRSVVRVIGTANADRLKEAHIEIGAGDNPAKWTAVSRPITKPIVDGTLADLSPDLFRSAKQWTLRVIVTGQSGLKREARFKLTLG